MVVNVVVRYNRDVLVARVVERLSQERGVVGKAAVAHVFSRGHGDLRVVVLSALKRVKNFANHYLRGEANVVVHVFFSKRDGVFPSHLQRNGFKALRCKRGRHDLAKSVRRVWNENDFFFCVALGEFDFVRLGKVAGLFFFSRVALHLYCLDKGTDANSKRPLHVAFVHL